MTGTLGVDLTRRGAVVVAGVDVEYAVDFVAGTSGVVGVSKYSAEENIQYIQTSILTHHFWRENTHDQTMTAELTVYHVRAVCQTLFTFRFVTKGTKYFTSRHIPWHHPSLVLATFYIPSDARDDHYLFMDPAKSV